MKIDPQLQTGVGKPSPRKPDKHRWRDIGNGMIECENTKEKTTSARLRGVGVNLQGATEQERTVTFTAEEWEKLERVAAWRTEQTKGRVKHTPESCLRGYISSALDGPSGWEHPATKK